MPEARQPMLRIQHCTLDPPTGCRCSIVLIDLFWLKLEHPMDERTWANHHPQFSTYVVEALTDVTG
jgi:hypothetical protein